MKNDIGLSPENLTFINSYLWVSICKDKSTMVSDRKICKPDKIGVVYLNGCSPPMRSI